ncbi:MAG: TadE/TadG family type IV pilus assembly protein, partial [Myxococcota bacterium]|nr:TadE/TadG family type IV pilus assembly protein [Myxococcota bacterium]
MPNRLTTVLRILLTFVGVSAACFASIQLFAPSPARLLSGSGPVAPGVIANVSFTGAPTGLAIGISLAVGSLVLLVWRMSLLVSSPMSPFRGLVKLRRAQAGQAITEFVIIFWALMMVVMGVAQMSLMYNAKNVTLYAAYAAARSAIVWIPMEADEEVNKITLSTGNEKYSNIKNSAVIACVPISRRASHVLAGLPLVGGLVMDVVNAITSMLSVIPGAVQVLD